MGQRQFSVKIQTNSPNCAALPGCSKHDYRSTSKHSDRNNKWSGGGTYCHRVLHVGQGRGELAEVQLGAVHQWVGQVSAAAARTHTRGFPLLAVGQDGRVVLSSGDPLETRVYKKDLMNPSACHLLI